MKTLRKLGMAILIALAFVGCKSQNATTSNNGSGSNGKRMTEGQLITIPCVDASYDDPDGEYFADLGIGTALNPQMARKSAIQASQSMIKEKLGGTVKGLATDYSNKISGSTSSADKVQNAIENEFTTVIDAMLNNAQKTCEDMVKLDDGNYRAYYAIRIPIKELVGKAVDVLSKDEELEVLFKRDQFRKFAEDYLSKQAKSGN